MFSSLCILGRQPALGLAELESLYGPENIEPVSDLAALLNKKPAEVAFAHLGGTVKFCKLLTILETSSWHEVQKFLVNAVPEHAAKLGSGKLRLGLSTYGIKVTPSQITAMALEIKKVLKRSGRSSRVIPNTDVYLNSAQVLYNKLTSEFGWELVLVQHGQQIIVAQTIAVQDIDAYAHRDRGRPKRDARIGMLPPKLAQVIINLASANSHNPTCGPSHPSGQEVLDPFCGTGVLLQEAALMGHKVYGSDIEPRLIEYSRANLDWLASNYKIGGGYYSIEVGDATNHTWQQPFNFIASEAYLGRPFTSVPSQTILNQTMADVNTIITKFLKNLAPQIQPGLRLCIALPAWSYDNKFMHLPVLDHLTDMGYNRVSFKHADNKDLVYYRPGQFVARELVVLIRK